ncbi:MAG: [FeFe] hydrogenase, group A, partial [Peptococcaceae bacterium]|nr:[FeFe] hydrogenase, group A [Peptococcaceae bacterium]
RIPTLCFYKDLCAAGACRICLVELEGADRLVAACNTTAENGMVIRSNSPRVQNTRRVNLELILADHNSNCPYCSRNMNCSLQRIARMMNIQDTPYENNIQSGDWPADHPLIKDISKCIYCMRCVAVCHDIQSLSVWDLVGTASNLKVDIRNGKSIHEVKNCALCGQCITHCPVGALAVRDDTDKVVSALNDPDKIVMFQIAPAIRTAWGEPFGLSKELMTVGRMVAAVRALGADYVFDTSFSADLTVMEEGSEFLERLKNRDQFKWPMFTSCCPGWVRFIKSQYPDMIDHLSTTKSPQQMLGVAAKTWFAQYKNIDPNKIFMVSIMPCIAKKHESALPNINGSQAGLDVDAVITNRELARLISEYNVNLKKLEEEDFDDLLGERTGAGELFGSTGGVMEAALRSVHYFMTGKNPDPDAYKVVRGVFGWRDRREATLEIGGVTIRAAIVSGLANARELIEEVRNGTSSFDFVEIMTCPGGCAGGGGQPITDGVEMALERLQKLYLLDKKATLRFSHENTAVQKAYAEYFEKPLSHVSHKLLHTNHKEWDL